MKILTFIVGVIITLIIIMTIFEYVAFDQNFYQQQFAKRATEEIYPDSWRWHQMIMEFHQGQKGLLPKELTQEEVDHLADVKKLYHLFLYFRAALAALLLLFLCWIIIKYRNQLLRTVTLSCAYCGFFGWMVFLLGMIAVEGYFSSYFHKMHLLMFHEGTFTFESNALLVTLYPKTLFLEMTRRFVYMALAVFSIMLLLGAPTLYPSRLKNSRRCS